jgi:outer membrane murein-binding lipoprotein Lpp
MTDEQIIEHCLASVAEYHPPCKVPDGIWAFTDRTLRSLLQEAIETAREQPIARLCAEWGLHPEEALPRGETWLHERRNWQAEVRALRSRIASLEQDVVAERKEKVRMADAALSFGCHLAGCIHEQRNDCDCGFWRELGMVG